MSNFLISAEYVVYIMCVISVDCRFYCVCVLFIYFYYYFYYFLLILL